MSGTASWLRVIQCVYYSDLPLRISWSLMAFRCVSTFAPSPDSFSRIPSFVGVGCWYMTENWDCNRILDKPQLFHTPVCSGASGGKCDAPLTTSTSTPPARIVISIKHPTRRAKWLKIGPSFIIFPFLFFFLHVYAASIHTYPSAARKITCIVWSPTQALRSRWFCYLDLRRQRLFPPSRECNFFPAWIKSIVVLCCAQYTPVNQHDIARNIMPHSLICLCESSPWFCLLSGSDLYRPFFFFFFFPSPSHTESVAYLRWASLSLSWALNCLSDWWQGKD